MVWFQCEDCGDNLKKPKLPSHFRACSASKLSCIDCGEVFGQHNVEGHTQCITEAEKYGPKGEGKASNGVNTKPKNDTKQKPEVDISVGLSERPPWFCSLCNTKATSKQTLLLHADGKKHRAKARAFHGANQKPNGITETKSSAEKIAGKDVPEIKDSGEPRDCNSSQVATVPNNFAASESDKKRKVDASEKDGSQHKAGGNSLSELGNGDVHHVNGAEIEVTKFLKKAKHSETQEDAKLNLTPDKDGKKKIKWKKLIASALKSNPDGVLKSKELKKLVAKSLKESGYSEDKNQVYQTIQQKINSSSKFVVNGKYVSLSTGS